MFVLVVVISLLVRSWLGSALILQPQPDDDVKVLVFGDSWGAWGPSWMMLDEMFFRHGVKARVVSTAIAGTKSCQWAIHPENIAVAAVNSFGLAGADFVWFTLGGNDLLDPDYQQCSIHSRNLDGAIGCARRTAQKTAKCNIQLLDHLFKTFPHTNVVQAGYDFECGEGKCVPFGRWPFCGSSIHCANLLGRHWAYQMLTYTTSTLNRTEQFRNRYHGISIVGSTQVAGKITKARVGSPVMREGSPCFLMFGCEHPLPHSPASFIIGEAFWNSYFKKKVTRIRVPSRPAIPPPFAPMPGWENQTDIEVDDVRCNQNWVPNLANKSASPPPCDRTIYNYLQL